MEETGRTPEGRGMTRHLLSEETPTPATRVTSKMTRVAGVGVAIAIAIG